MKYFCDTCGAKTPEQCWENDLKDSHITRTIEDNRDVFGEFLSFSLVVWILYFLLFMFYLEIS